MDFDDSCSATKWDLLKKDVLTVVDEKLGAEAAKVVEQLECPRQPDATIPLSTHKRNCREEPNASVIACLQNELRDLIMDVALLKRALMSLGQIGVMERRRVEKELILELFPPKQIRPGLGVVVAQGQTPITCEEDCAARGHLCKQACCRIFEVHLSATEVESGDRFDWNPKSPYALCKNHLGCIYLIDGKCTIYHSRPITCFTYSCQKDSRIWGNYEQMTLNPSLKQRLIAANLLPKDTSEAKGESNCENCE